MKRNQALLYFVCVPSHFIATCLADHCFAASHRSRWGLSWRGWVSELKLCGGAKVGVHGSLVEGARESILLKVMWTH